MAPITKNSITNSYTAKGMIPITKNVIVVDEQGNYYEATYPKRAKGLVKNGRARFIDENTICLACPPCDMEDNIMSENAENMVLNNEPQEKLSMNYVLEQLEKITTQTNHIKHAIEGLNDIDGRRGRDTAAAECAHAFADIVRSREATNQKLIALYEKMYDDLKPQPQAIQKKTSPESIAFFKERFSDPCTSIEEKGLLLGAIADLL